MTSQKNHLLYAATFCVLAVLLYGGMHFLSRAIADERSRIEGEYKLEAAREGARLLLKNELLALKKESTLLAGYFFDKENINELINLLESLGTQAGVTVVTERLAETEGKSGTLSFVLRAEGSENGVISYVEYLERAPYLLSIETVALGRFGEVPGRWTASVQLSAVGYEEH